ncbi:hypothetical protein RFI_06466, partial [Reticulomyxa filosa]
SSEKADGGNFRGNDLDPSKHKLPFGTPAGSLARKTSENGLERGTDNRANEFSESGSVTMDSDKIGGSANANGNNSSGNAGNYNNYNSNSNNGYNNNYIGGSACGSAEEHYQKRAQEYALLKSQFFNENNEFNVFDRVTQESKDAVANDAFEEIESNESASGHSSDSSKREFSDDV